MRNHIITHINSVGDAWFGWIVTATCESLLLFAIVGLIWLAVRRRVSPAVGYALFLLIPLKLLVPLTITLPENLAKFTPSGLIHTLIEPDSISEPKPSSQPQLSVANVPEQTANIASAPLNAIETKSHNLPQTRAASVAPAPIATIQAPPLSLKASAMLLWLSFVIFMMVRLFFRHVKLLRHLDSQPRLELSSLPLDFAELVAISRVTRPIRVVEDDAIAAPAVCGLFQPTIVLPRGLGNRLSPGQLRWVLLHELAHISRNDVAQVLLQRIATIVHVFNPIIWCVNPILNRLREFVCDDRATALSNVSGIESSQAFVEVLRLAGQVRSRLQVSLGVFGLDARTSSRERVVRLLDTERPLQIGRAGLSTIGIMIVAVLTLPYVHAKNLFVAVEPDQPAPAKVNDREFQLQIVGPDKKPVAGALAEFRTDPKPVADHIRRGEFVKARSYGTLVKADAEGRISLVLPANVNDFTVNIITPGYGPYWASWSSREHPQSIPMKFTAELEGGWTIGGVVVDGEGKPVQGASVRPGVEYKKPSGATYQIAIGDTVKTDAAGKWEFESVPLSSAQTSVQIEHPEFSELSLILAQSRFRVNPGEQPTVQLVMQKGLSVVGKITDESGKPITNALVRAKFVNTIRQARTRADGTYTLTGCDPRMARIVATAPGKATDMQEVSIEPVMGQVNFTMKRGGVIRVRVVDAQGKPSPGARILLQQWRGRVGYFEFDPYHLYADANGVWTWNEAPIDEFKADICPETGEGMQLIEQVLVAGKSEYVFKLPASLTVTGKVIDAETKQPIKRFAVNSGEGREPTGAHWFNSGHYTATDGSYRISRDRINKTLVIRIDAEGYRGEVSRPIQRDEGAVTIDFELKRGLSMAAKVLTPDRKPAASADVAIATPGAQISIRNGEFEPNQTHCSRLSTDASGRLNLPVQEAGFQIIVIHASGIAFFDAPAKWEGEREIILNSWAKVEGTFHIGKNSVQGVAIEIDVFNKDSIRMDKARVFTRHVIATNQDGQFRFDRVIPGSGRIGRGIMMMADDGATEVTSACKIFGSFPSGKTSQLNLGGTGRVVVGKLQQAAVLKEKPLWRFALMNIVPDSADDRNPYYTVTIDRDGKFRIDDIAPGKYKLGVSFMHPKYDAGSIVNYHFLVPKAEGDAAAQPVDLGTIILTLPLNYSAYQDRTPR